MNTPNLKRMHLLWFAPIAAIALLSALAATGPGTADSSCGGSGLDRSGPKSGCETASVDSPRETAEPDRGSSDSVHRVAARAPGYSEGRIRMLNELMPMPEAGPSLLEEIERLSLQQRRFERRYGPDSVAARSVRLRLHDLHDHVSSGLQYAAREKGNESPE